jgi:hypothetical protein
VKPGAHTPLRNSIHQARQDFPEVNRETNMVNLKQWPGNIFFVILLLAILVPSGCQGAALDIPTEQRQAIIAQAINYQTEGGVYQADTYTVTQLKKGENIYGMLPGQSVFYMNKAAVDKGQGSYKTLYALAQIRPHPVYGYRTKMGKYEVLEDLYVACGTCQANKTITIDGKNEYLGEGGGFQYVVFDYEKKLKLIEETTLHE